MYDEITKSLDNKSTSLGIFLDLSKAFDVINHKILLDKLYYYGIRGLPYNLIENYLSNRQQFVCIGNESSASLTVKCGGLSFLIVTSRDIVTFVNKRDEYLSQVE